MIMPSKIFTRDENEKILEEKVDSLKAHVELLRRAIVDCGMYIDDDHNRGVLNKLLREIPPQSLNHIKAQVEEETINRCRIVLREYGTALYIEEYLEGMQRKYKEQSDED